MRPDDIYGLDLNLLVVLHALLEENGVSRAATRIGRTQPAVSRSLQRLRDLLDDPLLVRTRHGMRPTARALALREPVRRLVADAAAIVQGGATFDPRTARRRFLITSGDATEATLMPKLLAALEAEAPGVDVVTRRESAASMDQLEDGEVDLVLTPTSYVSKPGLRTQSLFEEGFVCVLRAGHPLAAEGALDLDAYCRVRHALSAPLGRPGSVVDDALARLGRERRVAFQAPSFLAAGHVVAGTDLVATLPEGVAAYFGATLGLAQRPPPVELPRFTIAQFWHERRHHDPGHRWLRGRLRALVAD